MIGAELAHWVDDARTCTLKLVADLSDEQLMGPRLRIVNPLLWEIGHVAWFQEFWALRHAAGEAASREDADALYNSSEVPHDVRWDLPLPSREATVAYLEQVRRRVLDRIHGRRLTERDVYFIKLSVFHEDMHNEAFTYTRQTLEYPPPPFEKPIAPVECDEPARGDVEIPGGDFVLGATRDEPYVFDNEKWGHTVSVRPCAMARAAVTQGEFAAFVDDGGYERPGLWSDEGWAWREQAGASRPLYWQREANGRWLRRHFNRWRPLERQAAIIHVNWYEADAYCRWAGRRLPTEVEWEAAAAGQPDDSRLSPIKRRFPWGHETPTPLRANLAWGGMGTIDVSALPAGDSAFGCRQMVGNVWEWTSTTFGPYPGFVPDPYKDYSEPWFGTHKVLRGGAWATQPRLLRNTWRNFYTPDRRDVWAGFRTCAIS